MEHRRIVKHCKKRKSENELDPEIASRHLYPSDIQIEDLNHEIEQKLKRLRLNSSPLVSPKPEESILVRLRRTIRPFKFSL